MAPLAHEWTDDPRAKPLRCVWLLIYQETDLVATPSPKFEYFQMTDLEALSEPVPVNAPVLFLIFNRPTTTRRVFQAIRQARPAKLYVAADGPRPDRPDEGARCAEARRIATSVDWPCEVKTLFRETNLGCKMGVSGGINWFFEHEEEGIILEDDCLPHSDFFRFCDELLKRYTNDERVAVVTGNNFQGGQTRGAASYYFSKYNHVWGWATWRRAWRHYQGDLPFWPEWRSSTEWRQLTADKVERRYWENVFDRVYANKIDTWDYPWTASLWFKGGLTATPNVNLVSNIGFGQDSTHTVSADSPLAEIATDALAEIKHPRCIIQDKMADRYVFDYAFNGRMNRFPYFLYSFPRGVAGKIFRIFKNKLVHGWPQF